MRIFRFIRGFEGNTTSFYNVFFFIGKWPLEEIKSSCFKSIRCVFRNFSLYDNGGDDFPYSLISSAQVSDVNIGQVLTADSHKTLIQPNVLFVFLTKTKPFDYKKKLHNTCLFVISASKDDKYMVYFKTQTIHSIQHSNGRFSISEPGLYYVFCQIKFEHDPDSAVSPVSRQSHTLHKYSSSTGHKTRLLEKTRSFSELGGPENNGTSFIGAAFDLEKDDQIMVKSSHTHKLVGDDKMNFFGLYII